MNFKISYMVLLFIILISPAYLNACMCKKQIEDAYEAMGTSINEEILEKIPDSIEAATEAINKRIEVQSLERERIIEWVKKEQLKTPDLYNILFNLKKQNQLLE